MNERQELIELRRGFKQVQQECDILAKATAWFAGKSGKTSRLTTAAHALPGHAQRSAGAQAGGQLPAKSAAALHV